MIYIYVVSAKDSPAEPRLQKEYDSALAREVLFSALLKDFSLPEAEILRTECGKPYFEAEGYPAFSISHSGGLIAVAITRDGGRVGIDVESADRLCNTRLSDRFFSGLRLTGEGGPEIRTSLPEGASLAPAADTPTSRFTLGEAIIKCDGRGFAVAGEAVTLSEKMKKKSFIIKTAEGEWSLSIAVCD